MQKGVKSGFSKVLLLVIFILFINAGVIGYYYGNNFVGNTISDGFAKTYGEMPYLSKVFLAAQWGFLLLVLIVAFIINLKTKKHIGEVIRIKLRKSMGKSSTDLDTLYSTLQEKKKLKLSTIAKVFGVKEDIAMEWCKILESGNLASIDYPGVGEPIIIAK